MKYVIKILILLFILSCSKKQLSVTKENVVKLDTVSFQYLGFNHFRKLDLLSNNKFIRIESVSSCFGDGKTEKHFGEYIMTDSTLLLKPKKVELSYYSIIIEKGEEFKEEKINIKYGLDSLKINTNYQLFKWKNKEYLLSTRYDSMRSYDYRNDYEKFAYYYNIGEEPNKSGDYLTRIIEDDSINIKWDINLIPKAYRNNFLNEPISAKIIDRKKIIEKDESDPEYELITWQITINKGTDDGVTKKLHFTTKDDKYFIDIDSTKSKVSFGSCSVYNMEEHLFRIGTEMGTKWKE